MAPGEHKFLTVGKWAGAIAGLIGLVVTIWGGISRTSSLVDDVQEATEAIAALREENERIENEAHESLTRVVDAVRARAERDQEILTQLRIAVAALEAADRRPTTGRATPPIPSHEAGATVPAALTRRPTGDRTSDLRDARSAIERADALSIERDPLTSLEGL